MNKPTRREVIAAGEAWVDATTEYHFKRGSIDAVIAAGDELQRMMTQYALSCGYGE